MSYLFSRWHLDQFAHEAVVGLLFSVPAGLLLLSGLYLLAWMGKHVAPAWLGAIHAAEPAPTHCPQVWQPGTLARILVSLAIGAASHVLWDSFTHKAGWLAEQVPFLRIPLAHCFGRDLRPHHLLWYISSAGGAACMAWVWLRWRERMLMIPAETPALRCLKAGSFGMLIVLIAAAHHLVREPTGNVLAGVLTLLLLAWMLAVSRPLNR